MFGLELAPYFKPINRDPRSYFGYTYEISPLRFKITATLILEIEKVCHVWART